MEKQKGEGINKAVRIIVGILMILIGILFLAMPVLSAALVLLVAGIVLIVAGVVELITCLVKQCRVANRPPHIVTAIFKLALGALLLVADPMIVALLPIIFVIWLAAFGAYRIWLGVKRKREDNPDWATSVAIGCIAIVGAVAIAIVQWVAAMDMIGVLIAVLAMLYGFVLLLGAFVKSAKQAVDAGQRVAEDQAISDEMNEPFNEYKEKLHKK